MPQLPPTTTSSSMTTGRLPIGSSTPPIGAAADKCTRYPVCAHEPTSACESIIVSSSTYAPTFTNAGGIITTFLPQLPPTTTSSSMTTGRLPIGSSTPPICAAADKCTRFPICAHEPTSACESIIVSSSTYAQ